MFCLQITSVRQADVRFKNCLKNFKKMRVNNYARYMLNSRLDKYQPLFTFTSVNNCSPHHQMHTRNLVVCVLTQLVIIIYCIVGQDNGNRLAIYFTQETLSPCAVVIKRSTSKRRFFLTGSGAVICRYTG